MAIEIGYGMTNKNDRYGKKARFENILKYQLECALLDGIKAEDIWEIFSESIKISKEEVSSIRRSEGGH